MQIKKNFFCKKGRFGKRNIKKITKKRVRACICQKKVVILRGILATYAEK